MINVLNLLHLNIVTKNLFGLKLPKCQENKFCLLRFDIAFSKDTGIKQMTLYRVYICRFVMKKNL